MWRAQQRPAAQQRLAAEHAAKKQSAAAAAAAEIKKKEEGEKKEDGAKDEEGTEKEGEEGKAEGVKAEVKAEEEEAPAAAVPAEEDVLPEPEMPAQPQLQVSSAVQNQFNQIRRQSCKGIPECNVFLRLLSAVHCLPAADERHEAAHWPLGPLSLSALLRTPPTVAAYLLTSRVCLSCHSCSSPPCPLVWAFAAGWPVHRQAQAEDIGNQPGWLAGLQHIRQVRACLAWAGLAWALHTMPLWSGCPAHSATRH